MGELKTATEIIAPAILAIMMFSMGTSLKVDDFKRIKDKPKAVICGTLLQLLLIPCVGLLLIYIFQLHSSPLIIGVAILSCCPGGPGSNIAAYLCRGDTALSITLTTISSLYTIITVPLFINLLLPVIFHAIPPKTSGISISEMALKMIAITLVPASIGMTVNKIAPKFSERIAKPLKFSAIILLLILVINVFAQHGKEFIKSANSTIFICILLFLITFSLSYLISHLIKLKTDQKISISVEVGIQNSVMAIFIATNFYNNDRIAIPAIIYSPIMFTSIFALMFFVNLTTRKEENSQK
ncbi:MAG: bile acid:sodium symporter family protein [Gammaproteobacteria bacterium]|nr:MAG: bile acid:sodium symporter family protein [Gammaproteobacteria bacterium]